MKIAEKIINANPKMRFVGIIDLKGNIVEGIMKKGKTSLNSQKEVERERVTQLVVYTKKHTIFVTVEPELSITKKVQLVNSIKKITSKI